MSKAILASTIETIDQINEYVLNIMPCDEKEYLSYDSISMTNSAQSQAYQAIIPEFLHSLKTFGLPNYKIRLKIDIHIMLIRNLDQAKGLYHNTRLIVSRMVNHVIEAQIIYGKNIGTLVYIP